LVRICHHLGERRARVFDRGAERIIELFGALRLG
jgi:hypothetical protein